MSDNGVNVYSEFFVIDLGIVKTVLSNAKTKVFATLDNKKIKDVQFTFELTDKLDKIFESVEMVHTPDDINFLENLIKNFFYTFNSIKFSIDDFRNNLNFNIEINLELSNERKEIVVASTSKASKYIEKCFKTSTEIELSQIMNYLDLDIIPAQIEVPISFADNDYYWQDVNLSYDKDGNKKSAEFEFGLTYDFILSPEDKNDYIFLSVIRDFINSTKLFFKIDFEESSTLTVFLKVGDVCDCDVDYINLKDKMIKFFEDKEKNNEKFNFFEVMENLEMPICYQKFYKFH